MIPRLPALNASAMARGTFTSASITLALASCAFAIAVVALWRGNGYDVPFLLLCIMSLGCVGLQGLWDARLDLTRWLRDFVDWILERGG